MSCYGSSYTGTKLETADTDKDVPKTAQGLLLLGVRKSDTNQFLAIESGIKSHFALTSCSV